MEDLDPELLEAVQARDEGRYDDALRCLQAVTGRVLTSDVVARGDEFIMMFEWQLLTEEHAPARAALARLRDEQAERLMTGDFAFASGRNFRRTRFHLVVDMNEMLDDAHATWALFVRLEALAPEQARREAFLGLPAIVAAGDFERAERYLPRAPLDRLGELAALAQRSPLFPSGHTAPRMAAELSNFMKDVRLCTATLDGLGRGVEAGELREAALAGLPTDEMRALARSELTEPGTIIRALTAHQMAQEEAGSA
jgi:hypothetical protein